MKKKKGPFLVLFCLILVNSYFGSTGDYDTVTKADYVFSCMIPKGGSPIDLRDCSCSIDVIESILPLDVYTQAETILRMRYTAGEKTGLFKETAKSKQIIASLRRAQVIAEEKCFTFSAK